MNVRYKHVISESDFGVVLLQDIFILFVFHLTMPSVT